MSPFLNIMKQVNDFGTMYLGHFSNHFLKNNMWKVHIYRMSYIGSKTERLDKLLAQLFPDVTRSYIQTLCQKEKIVHNGVNANKKTLVETRDEISIFFPQEKANIQAENMDLDIVFENENFAVINKDPFVNVHPVTGEWGHEGTLVNGLLHHFWELSVINGIERPGIVHRLDKETSGLILIAKNDATMLELQRMFQEKEIQKVYHALVVGLPSTSEGIITSDIGRDRYHRKRMTTKQPLQPRYAETHYTTHKQFEIEWGNYALLEVDLKTGRTHQIRVHFADIDHPIVGDQVYGARKVNALFEKKFRLKRQFLHAYKLSFELFGESFSFTGDYKKDLLFLTDKIEEKEE